MTSAITTVILDFGGVLSLPQDPARVEAMAALCGLPRAAFLAAYARDRLELDRGTLAADDYWARLLARGGVAVTRGLLDRLEHEDALGWTRLNQPMIAWAAELRSAGLRTAILSNMPGEKLRFMRRTPGFQWINDFDAAYFSCDYRMVKPERAFYDVCLSGLSVPPHACLFLDDNPANVDAARSLGMQAMVFHSVEELAPRAAGDWHLPVHSLVNGAGR